jgi:hypothetical protein
MHTYGMYAIFVAVNRQEKADKHGGEFRVVVMVSSYHYRRNSITKLQEIILK